MSIHSQSPSRDPLLINKKRKCINYESEELAWTAARCNRLLRSITSRIAAIRKLSENNFCGEAAKPKTTVAKRVASHWSTQDPIWIGDAKRKTGARTFAGRKKVVKQQVPKEAPQNDPITFPSPFVRRIALGEAPSPARPFVRPAPPPLRQTRQLPIKPGSPLEEAERGLLSAFGGMLTATNEQRPPKLHGARSLMSTCLKNVPQYIAIHEEGELEEDVDIASEVISYLEDLGTKENGGWSGLREVVRSQAVYAICEAIQDGVLSEKSIRNLVEQCGTHLSNLEGQDILAAWIEAGASITTKQLGILNTFGREQNCVAFTFRTMRTAAERDRAHLEVFCKAPGFWNSLLRSLSRAASFDAESFLSTCLRCCLQDENVCSKGLQLGLKEAMIRLTTMAASTMLLDNTQIDHGSLCHSVHRLAVIAVFSGSGSQPGELSQILISCSLFLLGVSQKSHGSLSTASISYLLSSTTKSRSHYSDFADEIITSMTTLEQHLQADLSGLLLERLVDQAGAVPLLRQIALAAITAKQQSYDGNDNEALFADYIHRISIDIPKSTEKVPRTPLRKPPKAQFRWEDGICEWVAKTPFTAATATMAPPTPPSIPMRVPPKFDDKENCCPTNKEVCASIKKEACLLQNSPDVLALSPQKRVVAESPLRPRQMKRQRLSSSQPVLREKGGRRRASRDSSKSRMADDSADELGF